MRVAFLVVLIATLLSACARREPIVIEAEELSGIDASPRYGLVAATRWGAYDEPTYSRERGAITRAADAVITTSVAGLENVKTWRAEVVVLNYEGAQQNVFELSVGGVKKTITYGAPQIPQGLLRIDDLYFHGVANNTISIRSIAVGQVFLVVDRIRLFPDHAEAPRGLTSWERPIPRIVGEVCHNCLEAESLSPVDADPNYGVTAGAGWASYAESSYSGGRAALTRLPGAVMKGHIPNLRPRRPYRVTLAVNSASTAENTIDLQLGEEETQRITFGGATGLVLLKNIVFESVATDLVAVRANAIGQPYLIVDAISFEPLDAMSEPTTETWRATKIDPIQSVCSNCIEAETIAGVNHDPNYGVTTGDGWASYQEANYSGKRAALTRLPGATMTAPAPNFIAGSYDVTLTVLSLNAKENVIALTMGGQTKEVRYGPELTSGLHRLRPVRFTNVSDPKLSVTATAIAQPYVILDTISVRPVR